MRLQDSAAALVGDLSDVAAQLGGVAGEALLDATAAQVPACTLGLCPHTNELRLGSLSACRRRGAARGRPPAAQVHGILGLLALLEVGRWVSM